MQCPLEDVERLKLKDLYTLKLDLNSFADPGNRNTASNCVCDLDQSLGIHPRKYTFRKVVCLAQHRNVLC